MRDLDLIQEGLSRLEVDAWGVASLGDQVGTRLHDQAVALLPEARSVVVMAMEIFPEVLEHSRPNKLMGEASLRDMLVPHMDFLNGRLTKAGYDLARLCHSRGFKALPMPAAGCPTDQRYLTAALSYKHAAEAAGLGTMGRHSLLVTREFGPRVRLACVLTDAELQPTPRPRERTCDGCNECVVACPADALELPEGDEPYRINKYACSVFRGAAGPCSECMRVCPQGR
jgi:epoxyqueuosine reductase QueG